MNIADKLRIWFEDHDIFPAGYRIQFGVWKAGSNAQDKYVVIKNTGGVSAELVRRPQLSVTVIGSVGQNMAEIYDLLDSVVEKMKVEFSTCGVPYMNPAEPMTYQTSDGRPVAELDIAFIMSLTE